MLTAEMDSVAEAEGAIVSPYFPDSTAEAEIEADGTPTTSPAFPDSTAELGADDRVAEAQLSPEAEKDGRKVDVELLGTVSSAGKVLFHSGRVELSATGGRG